MKFETYPAAVYKNGESKAVADAAAAEAAEKDGWRDTPEHLPVVPPEAGHLPSGRPPHVDNTLPETAEPKGDRRPHVDNDLPDPHARPKKKGE